MTGWLALTLLGCVPDIAPNDHASNPDHDFDGDGFVEDPTAERGGDCDDRDASAWPGAPETCDGTDEDCDGEVDENATDVAEHYRDQDRDGYGTPDSTLSSCQVGDGYAANSEDCDDQDASVNPDALEICEDRVDNDCDGLDHCQLDDGLVLITGDREDDHAGHAIARGADLNDDGVDDLLIGAPENDGGSSLNTTNNGALYVIYGPITADQELSVEDADHSFLGVELGRAGASIAVVGDVDAGGLVDILVGSPGPGSSTDTARVHLVLGEELGPVYRLNDHTTWTALITNVEGAGAVVDGGCDVDGDGLPEMLVGSEPSLTELGQAWLIWGNEALLAGSASLNSRGVQLVGSQGGDKAGSAVQALGDVDGDGLDDFAIGAQRWGVEETGAVFLVSSIDIAGYRGGDAFYLDNAIIVAGDTPGARWGGAISPGADVNGDGLEDFFVGAPGYDSGEDDGEVGAVNLIIGRSGGGGDVGNDTLLTGVGEGQSFGAALDLDDFNGDGVVDLITGAPARGSSALPGTAYVHLGPLGSGGHLSADQADWRYADDAAGSEAGASVTLHHGLLGAGTVLTLGLPRWSVNDSDGGAVVVVPYPGDTAR